MHTLKVKERETGKANALRRRGLVPGIVYGPAIDAIPIAIEQHDLRVLFSKVTRSSSINLSIDGDERRELDVFLKVVDYDPITDEPLHVDFYHPEVGVPLKLHVPVKIVGESPGVKAGGILNVLFNDIRVHGLPKDIPHLITLDVSQLDLGDSIHVSDIDFGNVEPLLPPERTIVTVIAPRGYAVTEEEEAEEGEIEAEAEGEESPGAETGETEGEGE